MRNWWVVGIGILIWGCKSTANVSSADAYANYQETITSPLPEYPDFTTRLTASDESENSSEGTVNLQLEALQKRIYDKNKSEPYFSGFTVYIFLNISKQLLALPITQGMLFTAILSKISRLLLSKPN